MTTIQHWAADFGGIGMFVIAFLDSSFLSFPQVNDLLLIVRSTRNPARMPWFAGMTTLGSLLGCFALYIVIRRGGEKWVRNKLKGRFFDRAITLYQKYGLMAVIVPALLPPPVPFKAFVFLAAAAGVSPLQFGLAILIGRGIRYFGEGYLAVLYGEQAADFLKKYGAEIGIGLAVAAVVIGFAVVKFRQKR